MRTLSIILALYSLNAIAQTTFESAAEAARKVPLPAFESVVTQSTLNATLPPASFGDTTPLSSLRGDKGMGDLSTPGFNKSVACDTQNDPECLAIQMVKRGSANRPKLDEKTVEKLIENHTEIMTQSPTLLGELAGLAHTEKTCEKIEQVIPGVSTTEVCDITVGTNDIEATCEEGWEESRSPWVSYVCTMTALPTQNVCTVTTTPVTHDEHLFACTDRQARIEEKSCTVPATVSVKKTHPYTCPVTLAAEEKKTCVKTLKVVVTPLCSVKDPPQTEIRLNDYRTLYGWRPGSAYYGFQVIMECRASLDTFSVKFVVNGTVLGTVTSLPARIETDIKGFGIVIDARRTVIDHEHVIAVDVTNVDTGLGTTTLSGTVVMETLTQQEHEVWSETCEARGS